MGKQDAIQILSKSTNGTLELDQQALKSVLETSWDKPTAVISICGEKRKGKSFMINLLIHHLTENLEKKLLGKLFNQTLEPTFEWRGGQTRNTEGIWITSSPITLETKQGPVNLYVMDTQGMFDNKTSKQEADQIFTLATLMSSVLVFNLFRQIQSNDIEHLTYWTRIANWVGNEQSSSSLQNLVLLIRDFPHQSLGYGVEGGKKYISLLEKDLSESNGSEEVSNNVKDLQKLYPNVGAFAMPAPGSKIMRGSAAVKPIKIKDIDKKFRHNACKLFKELTTDLSPLLLNQSPMTGSSLYDYVLKCSERILTKEMPHSKDLSEHVADQWLNDYIAGAVNDYRDKMHKVLEHFYDEFSDLQKVHEKEKTSRIHQFEKISKFGKSDALAEARVLIEEQLDKQFEKMSYHVRELSEARQREETYKKEITNLRQRVPPNSEDVALFNVRV